MGSRADGRYILALDQGTTSSRAILFDIHGEPVAVGQRPLPSIFPQPGWVEQDPEQIVDTQLAAAHDALTTAGASPSDIVAIGIANQRETTIVWDKKTGRAVHNAIVWQCRRTADDCRALAERGLEPTVRDRTGLVIDPYFSGTKVAWILRHIEDGMGRAERGELAFGTVDSWLIWRLSGGAHLTDATNASRTMLYDIRRSRWDAELLDAVGVPTGLLPGVVPSSGIVARTGEAFPGDIPIAGIAGDQQAALFGQACLSPGMTKNTYGTGCFLLMNAGATPPRSSHGLLATIAWQLGDEVTYALEGSVFIAGSVIKWLRDQLGVLQTAEESQRLAESVPDTQGVYFVPAFTGLGAPHWDADARGVLVGLTQGADRRHIVRAGLESIAYQTADVLSAMEADTGLTIRELRVDGGACANDFLMRFQAGILGVPVLRPRNTETTAAGAAYLAGLAVGFYESTDHIAELCKADQRFAPAMDEPERSRLLAGWHNAVRRSLSRGPV